MKHSLFRFQASSNKETIALAEPGNYHETQKGTKQHGFLWSSSSHSLPLHLVLSISGHKSDEALIQNLCHKTPEPVLCADCLHLDPGSKDADGRGVALITVRCAESDAEQVYNFTFNLWQKTPKSNVALYNTLDTCSIQFLVAHDSFRGATVALEKGVLNWRGAAMDQLTSQVSPYLNRCLDLFKKQPQLPLPNTILIGTEAVNQGIAISLGILKNIPDKLTLS